MGVKCLEVYVKRYKEEREWGEGGGDRQTERVTEKEKIYIVWKTERRTDGDRWTDK